MSERATCCKCTRESIGACAWCGELTCSYHVRFDPAITCDLTLYPGCWAKDLLDDSLLPEAREAAFSAFNDWDQLEHLACRLVRAVAAATRVDRETERLLSHDIIQNRANGVDVVAALQRAGIHADAHTEKAIPGKGLREATRRRREVIVRSGSYWVIATASHRRHWQSTHDSGSYIEQVGLALDSSGRLYEFRGRPPTIFIESMYDGSLREAGGIVTWGNNAVYTRECLAEFARLHALPTVTR